MNHHLSRALAQTYTDDLDRAARQRPQPRRRRQATRPRDSLDDIAHATRSFRPTPLFIPDRPSGD
jgi:hypothetical protein